MWHDSEQHEAAAAAAVRQQRNYGCWLKRGVNAMTTIRVVVVDSNDEKHRLILLLLLGT